jgi:putative inorganic carbon (HCO3(-)) transporter
MRDVLVFLFVLGPMPLIIYRPYIGVLMLAWIGYMNPHRFAWGAAYEFPFVQLAAVLTMGALLVTSRRRGLPLTPLTVLWVAFVAWMGFTTLFALNAWWSAVEFDRAMKIQLLSFVTIFLIYEKKHINALVWVIAGSIGFYGVKGGIFAILSGGGARVYGPVGSFIEDNNSIGLALIMIIPLLRYLQIYMKNRWGNLALLSSIGLCSVAAAASQSRGAFVGGIAMVGFLFMKSRHKLRLFIPLIVALVAVLSFMPQTWWDRMATIQNYEQDESALGRINAWQFAINLTADRPFVGGGFGTFTRDLFLIYAPEPENFHDSHSIYFEMLAEHGYVGLLLFLALGILAFRYAGKLIRAARGDPELEWIGDLAAMLQVSIIGYAVTGAFLGLAYFDLYYQLIALIVVMNRYVRDRNKAPAHASFNTGAKQPGQVESP